LYPIIILQTPRHYVLAVAFGLASLAVGAELAFIHRWP
jgi:hypothetical protein